MSWVKASLLALALAWPLAAPAAGQEKARIQVPPEDVGVDTLDGRARVQAQRLASSGILHDFRYEDRVAESGIGFVHRIVDDAGYEYKPVHYDHGNGVAAADVDGDDLPDLYFVNQIGRNEMWRNLGGGRFEDVTEAAGVGLEDRISVTASFGDIDGDGDPDLFVTTVRMGNVLFENQGDGRFRDVSARAGVDYSGHSSGAVFFDYDLDGRLDLFVTNVGRYTTEEQGRGGYWVGNPDAFLAHDDPARAERSILYRNVGDGRFEDVSEATGLVDTSWSGDAAFADLTGDAYPDLYVLNMQGDDHYWENRGGEGFVDRTAEVFPKTSWGAMGIEVLDVDGDGRLDVYISDMHSDMTAKVLPGQENDKSVVQNAEEHYSGVANNILGNALFRNLGDGRFEEVSDALGAENYWPWGLSAGDLNADGREDVLVTASMNFPYRYAVNVVLLNDGGRFVRAEMPLGVEPRKGRATHTEWFDLDCGGKDAERPLCADHSGPVTVMATLGTRSSVLLDLDADGDLDIVTSDFNSAPQVLVSDLAQRHPVRHLHVRLLGRSANRDGLGAVIRVHAGGSVQTKPNDGKSGYLSQSSLPVYFGLGTADVADRVEVVWPGGAVQVVEGPVAAGTLLEIEEEPAAEEPTGP